MAIIKQNKEWNNIPVRLETNNETGRIEIYGVGQGSFGLVDTILFSSDGKGSDWYIPNLNTLTHSFNKVNGKKSTTAEVEKAFYLEGYKVFNDDRATVLNSPQSYDSYKESVISRQIFYNQKTPGIINPNTGLNINSDGDATNLANIPQQQETDVDSQRSETPSPSPIRVGGVITKIVNTPDTINSTDTTTTKTIVPSITSVGLLRYPLANLEAAVDLGITYDYIKINIQEWVSSIAKSGYTESTYNKKDNTFGGTSVRSASKRYKQNKGTLGTIILPMTSNLGSTNGIGWGEANANAIEMTMMATVNGFLQRQGEGEEFLKNIKTAGTNILQGATDLLNQGVDNKDGIASLLAGYVIGNTSMATRASGITINPNMELLFSGPKLRTFNFNFQFAPRFRAEAEVVRKIIRAFKMFSAPKIDKTGGIFLKTPKIFQLEYIYNGDASDVASGQKHPYLNKIKPCALTNVSVNYTPGGKYMTYADGGSMVQTTLNMTFTEVEPIYELDYREDDPNQSGY